MSTDKYYEYLFLENKRPTIPIYIPQSMREMIELGWASDMNLRPTLKTMLEVLEAIM